MTLHQPNAELYVPDGKPAEEALRRVTHLGIGAHQDDLEFMAFHGIIAGYEHRSFAGVTCTNGSGSARSGRFAGYTDEQMCAVRREEQREAARLGRYRFIAQLDYPSRDVKSPGGGLLRRDLGQLLAATRPQVVYTHNPADKHDTHIGVMLAVVDAIRSLPGTERPGQCYGCEVWRDLDWLPDEAKVVLDVSGHDELAGQLNAVFASQIAGGKRYDLAVVGRRKANATFFQSHATDQTRAVTFAMDLTPLVRDETRDVAAYVGGLIDQFRADVVERLSRTARR